MEENKYTKEQMLKEMGINERLIRNEETRKVLVRFLDYVSEVDFSNISTQEDFARALEIYSQKIDVEKEGNSIFGIRKKEGNTYWTDEIDLLEDDNFYLNINIIKDEQENDKNIIKVKRQENVFKLKEDNEDVLLGKNEKEKTISQPNKESITRKMMKNIQEIKEWDEEKTILDGWRNTRDIMHYDDKINTPSQEKKNQFRENLRDSAQQDENVKLNPKIVTNKETLMKNILEKLGVNKKILEKPELLSQLDGVIEYVNNGENLETVEDVQGVMEKLKQSMQITENSVSAIKAKRRYINTEEYSYDITEGVKIDVNENKYTVENIKMGRGFQNEQGNLEVRQQNKKMEFRENRVDSSKVELEELLQKEVRINQNLGQEIGKGEQDKYLIDNAPTQYGQMENMFENALYKTMWRDDRTIDQQRADDVLRIEEEELKNQEQR